MTRRRVSLATAIVVAGLVTLAVVAPSISSAQTDTTEQDTVTVTAVGRVEGRPDLASISFGVRGTDPSAQDAMDLLARRQKALIDALHGLGLGEEEVTTGNISLRRNCRYNRDLERTVCRGYIARTSVRAETTDLDQVGKIIDTGVRAGAGSLHGVSFERTEDDAAIAEALAQAIDLATAKAQALADRAGRDLGRVMVIEEGGARRPVFSEAQGLRAAAAGFSSDIVVNPPDEVTRVVIVVTFALN